MMRRIAEVTAVVATFVALVATSPAPRNDCKVETLPLMAVTNCGAPGSLTVTSSATCAVKTDGPGASAFPLTGYLGASGSGAVQNATLRQGFVLERYSPDGGLVTCSATAADAGFAIRCDLGCSSVETDGGYSVICGSTCEGALTP